MEKTYGVQYLGSKAKLTKYIINLTNNLNIKTAVDVFTGTTRVAQALRQNGVKVITSDLSEASQVYSNALVKQQNNSHLQKYIDKMNSFEGYKGWITENYSGGEEWEEDKGDGRYIYPSNAMKADAARDYIETLDLNVIDKDTLICSIIFAINKVNNSVGQQQAYLKDWCTRSKNDIIFLLPPQLNGPKGGHIVGDCLKINYPSSDLAYLDPPYTSTVAYHTYYHIWDSIALWDKPKTGGKARRRIDRVKRNNKENYNETFLDIPWYDTKNLDNIKENGSYKAFKFMVEKLDSKYIMISYSNESIISLEQMVELLSQYGDTEVYEIDHKRMIMGSIGHSSKNKVISSKNPNVTEYIFLLTKNPSPHMY